MRLARRDYERVLAFLEAAHAVKGPSPFTPELLDRLASIASCEAATFLEHVPGRNDVSSCVTWSGEDPDVLIRQAADPAKWASTRTAELTRRKSRSGGPVVLADLFPRRLRARADFNFNYRDYGVADEIHVDLDGAAKWTAEVAVFRDRDFGPRERLIFELLRPHLSALYRAAMLRRRLAPATAAAESLTRREREVVELVAEGLSNAEIGRALVIAPSTVRKHLEHVYEKLGVGSRTAAVAKVRGG